MLPAYRKGGARGWPNERPDCKDSPSSLCPYRTSITVVTGCRGCANSRTPQLLCRQAGGEYGMGNSLGRHAAQAAIPSTSLLLASPSRNSRLDPALLLAHDVPPDVAGCTMQAVGATNNL